MTFFSAIFLHIEIIKLCKQCQQQHSELEGYSQNLRLAKKVSSNRKSTFLNQLSWYLSNITYPFGVFILTKFYNLRMKTLDVLLTATFWPSRKFWEYPSMTVNQEKNKRKYKCANTHNCFVTSLKCGFTVFIVRVTVRQETLLWWNSEVW